MSNIHLLPAATSDKPKFEPYQPLVEELEKLLELAKRGKLQALAWASVYADDKIIDSSTSTGWAMAGGTSYGVANALLCLNYRYAAWRDRQSASPIV